MVRQISPTHSKKNFSQSTIQEPVLEVEESWNLLGVICLPEGVFHLAANTTTRADIVILERRSCKNNKISKTIFASAPAVGMPLSSREGEQENYLNAIISNPAAVSLLGIDKP